MSNSNVETRRVQSSITSVSFPTNLEELRKMGRKWVRLIGKDWITDMDVLFDFPRNCDIPWIAPKWLTTGDILFFYHTKRAKSLTRKLYKEAKELLSLSLKDVTLSIQEIESLVTVLERAVIAAQLYSGTILGFAEVSGSPQRMFDEFKHFKGTVYAPLSQAHTFEYPLEAENFAKIVSIGQPTITPLYGSQFDDLKKKLALRNRLPKILEATKSGGLSWRDVEKDNWDRTACNEKMRFVNEAQIRYYFINYLLNEIKDTGTPIHIECECYKGYQRTGIADYYIKLGGKWLPVEAKLNIVTETDLFSQIEKYIHVDSFIPRKGYNIKANDSPFCVVIDQAGLYLMRDDEFVDCNFNLPLHKREDLNRSEIPKVREHLIKLMVIE